MHDLGLPGLQTVITVNESYRPSGRERSLALRSRPQAIRKTHLDKKILGPEGSN